MAWQFNKTIADTFDQHARQHIPNYDQVIDLSVDLCNQRLNKDASIVEIGCAVGETVVRLHGLDFINIHAVDASQEMLDNCPKAIATYYCSNTFPNITADAVLCNWTLHFIKDKVTYLQDIYQHLSKDGFLVLSEKTSTAHTAIEQYHLFKERNGVSRENIIAKAESLKGVMFVESVEWYLSTLRSIGFKEVYIVNADWCFTTFVAIKS